MIDTDAISPDIPYATLLAVILLVAAHFAGWLVLRLASVFRRPGTILIVTLPLGVLLLTGIASLFFLGRICYLSVFVLIPIGMALAARVFSSREDSVPLDAARIGRRDLIPLAVAFLFSVCFSHWLYIWCWRDGSLTLPYRDLGYFCILVKDMTASATMSLWSGTLGASARAAGASDVWYHWGPVWLGCIVSRLGGVSPLVAMLHVVVPVLTFLVVFAAGTVFSVVVRCSIGKGMCMGALALVSLPIPTVTASPWMMKLIPGGIEQHLHLSLAYRYCFTYRLEAFIVFAAIGCWLANLRPVAVLFLFFAGVSAPHSVGGIGVMAGAFTGFAILRRSSRDFRLGVAVIAVLLSAWAANVFLFGVGLPMSGKSHVCVLDAGYFWRAGFEFLRSSGVGILLSLPLLVGLVFLIRHTNGDLGDRVRALGWAGISALFGSYAAYHLLLPEGERNHFVGYTHAILIFPLSVLGLVLAVCKASSWRRNAAFILLVVCGLFGAYDGWMDWRMVTVARERYTADDLRKMKAVLHGQKYGYFATADRQWWIPGDASLAAILGASCTRLNFIPEIDQSSVHARFYGGDLPLALVPQIEGESSSDWALRFARVLGIHFLIESDQHILPPEIKEKAVKVAEAGGLKLYELRF